MKSYKIDDGFYWVGVQDHDLKVFDVIMSTEFGTSYNSYFVQGEDACAIIEGTKNGFFDEWKSRLEDAGADLTKIDYIVLNHTEPDHTGAVYKLLEYSPDITVVCSRAASNFIKEIVNQPMNIKVVNEGDKIDLGGMMLEFLSTPFLHWPDSMFTYIPERKALISGDVFGFHHHWPEVFEKAHVGSELLDTQKYYFDVIMSPFKSFVLDACKKARKLDISVICPSHGPVLDDDPIGAIDRYEQWATVEPKPEKTVLIAYVSCYGFTKKLAYAISSRLNELDVSNSVYDISEMSVQEVVKLALDADAIVLGSPTLNRDALEPVWEVLSNLSAIVCKGKVSAAFGSYGWSGEATKYIVERMGQLGMKNVGICKAKMNPNDNELASASALADDIASALNS